MVSVLEKNPLLEPLTLPNGVVISNRIAKAAMEEGISDRKFLPGEKIFQLYSRWAKSGAGLLITGNVMVDPNGLTGPGNVILRKGMDLSGLKKWAKIAKSEGSKILLQINHPGRQTFSFVTETPVAPSPIKVKIPGRMFEKVFGVPRALRGEEIRDLIQKFVNAALLAEEAGFDGVEVHSAHGYLINQFLSPITNIREDEWGGSLENRARFLVEVVKGIRAAVKPGFCLGVKLNSADFQGGGFQEEDSIRVIQMLEPLGVDLLEISGGNYESPAMQGGSGKREAYFLEFAKKAREITKIPLLVTGGFRTRSVMQEAISSEEADMIGIATPFAFHPEFVHALAEGKIEKVSTDIPKLSNPAINSIARMSAIRLQFRRMGEGKEPKLPRSLIFNLILDQIRGRRNAKRYKKFLMDGAN
ncbi:NADH:flavin oxidoreductase/NADH oxidase family protein [Leptospira langatensis]|uniref:NADH:flavin oxidoreductase/NADH oxidase family protein n=1 Tax=Leptospira langatensis TaxID=2484983 RepID=A0A5F1ZRL2_9LEPT|nr:NADH:flavin oxidoreductase/NADH oxidase family protein [Leptospira langatensis]TGK02670.1 NADH:flavin oxidoreductase/NADH oxidase family protein [Leptospira langatensis]TGL40127.1 NADH:flavin oxidoreductase/NADH oxidase family protein [Leptospira langatensis]